MGIFDRRKPMSRLSASSGGIIKGGSPATPAAMLRKTQDWQLRILGFADTVPEVASAASFVSNTTSRVKYEVVGTGGIDADLTRQLIGAPTARALENLFLVGEVVVSFKYDPKTSTTEWKTYGKKDYQAETGKPILIRNDAGKFVSLPEGEFAFRVWRPDRSDMYSAWSAHKANLDLLEAMYVHQLADTAVAMSRLAGAGILYIPNDEMIDTPDLDGGEPERGSQAEFEQLLQGAMLNSISHRESSDAVVPLVMFGAAENAVGLTHLMMERADDAKAYAERMEAYRKRYASGIDLPIEVVTGMGQTNHWAAWKVDQNTWSYYLSPLVDIFAQSLEKNFLAPVAEQLKAGTPRIIVDPKEVVVKPDRTDAAIRLFAAGAMSADGALKAAGFETTDVATGAAPKANAGTQPDGAVRMPSANFRGSEGTPVGDRNLQR